MIVTAILNDNGIDANLIGLSGHVVLQTNVNNKWYILDPDYGVAMPYHIFAIENNPELIRPYYDFDQEAIFGINQEDLVAIYGKPNIIVLNSVIGYTGAKVYYFEELSYALIWIFPLFLILLGFLTHIQIKK